MSGFRWPRWLSPTTVQDHPGSDLTAEPSVSRADISEMVLVEMEIAPDLVGFCPDWQEQH